LREAEERRAKKAKENEELAKAAEENEKDQVNSKEEKPEEKEKAKEGNKDGRPPSEDQKQDKAERPSKIKVKSPFVTTLKTRRRNVQEDRKSKKTRTQNSKPPKNLLGNHSRTAGKYVKKGKIASNTSTTIKFAG
jgi:hypothetical protein